MPHTLDFDIKEATCKFRCERPPEDRLRNERELSYALDNPSDRLVVINSDRFRKLMDIVGPRRGTAGVCRVYAQQNNDVLFQTDLMRKHYGRVLDGRRQQLFHLWYLRTWQWNDKGMLEVTLPTPGLRYLLLVGLEDKPTDFVEVDLTDPEHPTGRLWSD